MEKFISKIHQEILQTLDRRHKLDIAKITFTTSLLGLGSFSIRQNPPLISALFLAPLVALSFDLLIMRESHSIIRMGDFIASNQQFIEAIEFEFEKTIKQERNTYYRVGLTLLSSIIWLASLLLFLYSDKSTTIGIIIFFFIYLFILGIHVLFFDKTVLKYDYKSNLSILKKSRLILNELEIWFLVIVLIIAIILCLSFPTSEIIVSHYQNQLVTLLDSVNQNNKEYDYSPVKLAIVSNKTKDILKNLSRTEKKQEKKYEIIQFLINAKLIHKINLDNANLSSANLRGLNLKKIMLSGANLSRANLSGANLSEANLSGANLSEANLSEANLSEANLQEAIIIEVRNLTSEQINSACFWEQAIHKGNWDSEQRKWIIEDKNNNNFLKSLKQNNSSNSQEIFDCSVWTDD